jgi:hypothetical protein
MAHTDEIERSSTCRLLEVDLKWLTCVQNDANGRVGIVAYISA